jgi:adenylylsulfate kinase-like enzyme
MTGYTRTHLARLEAEAVYVLPKVSAPYERPSPAERVIDTGATSVDDAVSASVDLLRRGRLPRDRGEDRP